MAVNLNDGFSRDELKEWTVAQLYRSFLRDHGVVIFVDGGWKKQVVETVYHATTSYGIHRQEGKRS